MADLAQLERALIKADAAGDADAARVFAGEIRRMRSASVGADATPLKIGADGFPDALRDTLKSTDWATRNIAGAGSAVMTGLEGLKGLVGKSNPSTVRDQGIIGEEAPVGNILGNVAMLAPTAFIPGANTAGWASTIGALQGALLTPGGVADRAKAGAIGVAGSLGGLGLSRLIGTAKPIAASADAQLLAKEGISLTPGQNAGGWMKTLEDKLTSTPFVGNVIQNARRRGIEDFDKAAMNRVMRPLGQEANQAGRAGFADTKQAIKDAYDGVLPKLNNIGVDQQFTQDMGQLKQMAQLLPKDKSDQFDRLINYYVDSRFTPAGRMSGEIMKEVESNLGQQAGRFGKSPLPDDQTLGDALKQAQANLRAMVQRTNPGNAEELQKINGAFANYARLRRAASGVGTAGQDGLFTPAQLNNAVRAMDTTAGKSSYGSGTALMQDLTDPAMRVMPSKIPDSGTAGRLMADLTNPLQWPGMAVKGAVALPMMAAYSRPGSAVLNAGMNRAALPTADMLRGLLADPNFMRLTGASSGLLAFPEFAGQ